MDIHGGIKTTIYYPCIVIAGMCFNIPLITVAIAGKLHAFSW